MATTAAQGYLSLRRETDQLLDDLGGLLRGLKEDLPADSEEKKNNMMKKHVDSYDRMKTRHQEQVLSVGVVALTKSGKSTFSNAVMGLECMPSGIVPQTARICRIVHDPAAEEPCMHYQGEVYRGTAAVHDRLLQLNANVRNPPRGEGGNPSHHDEDELYIYGRLAALAQQPAMPVPLHLIDTPGRNEAGAEQLKQRVDLLMDDIGVLVYILDCTKLKTQDENEMFQRLKDINPQLLERLSERLFFLVNKKDLLRNDMTEEGVRQYVADEVTRQMDSPNFRLDPRQVMLMSASNALYSRLVMNGVATPEQHNEFAKIAFGQVGYEIATEEMCKAAAPKLFQKSGIPEIEDRILGFLYTNGRRLHMQGTLDDISRLLGRVMNMVRTGEAALIMDHAELARKSEGMKGKFERVIRSFDEVKTLTDKSEKDATDQIRQRMQSLQNRLNEQVMAVLSESNPPAQHFNALGKLWELARSIFQQNSEKLTQEDAQRRLEDLFHSMNSKIDEEKRAFWYELEVATIKMQNKIFTEINAKVMKLAKEVEGEVAKELKLDVLVPADITIPPPSHAQHHENLKELFARGITTQEVEREEHVEVVEMVKEKKTVSICWTKYYDRPVTRTEVKKVIESHIHLSPDNVREFFKQHIDMEVTQSIKSVRVFVKDSLTKTLKEARGKLEDYCQQYQDIMGVALQNSLHSENARRQALDFMRQHAATASELITRLSDLRAEV